MKTQPFILAIESSCDETSAAVLKGKEVLSNIIAGQLVHGKYGGVVPELASRAHQSNIVPVVKQALSEAGLKNDQIDAIAFTQGPGLMGSLLVGTSFAKSLSLSLQKPLIAVNHMQAHILAHFISNQQERYPGFPFLCLTVSGGHTQIVLVKDYLEMKIIGETRDDAAGEAFDKAAKLLGLPYPGGPHVDKQAKLGNAERFKFPHPQVADYDYSFSGLKTSLLYFLKGEITNNPNFIEENKADICASYQRSVVDYTLKKFMKAALDLNIQYLCLAGGVSANSELRSSFLTLCEKTDKEAFIPPFVYCTDNAAMIGIAAYFKYEKQEFADLTYSPLSRMPL